MPLMRSGFDYAYRPATYWPESQTIDQLLTQISGQARRELARFYYDQGGFAALDAFLVRSQLPEPERSSWGRVHPAMMGGEYLPPLRISEVEIARISLESTTYDQISIRARQEADHIRYTVVDEYEDSTFELSWETSPVPSSLGEMIEFIDKSAYAGDYYTGGLAISHLNANFENGACAEELSQFVSVESAFYHELGAYYALVLADWVEAHMPADEDEVNDG